MNSTLKEKLNSGKLTIGSWVTLAHPAIAEIMSKAGFEWIVVDLEHSTLSLREAEELIRTIELRGSTPLVRLSSNNATQIKRIMDAGAHGIIVPMVMDDEEAKNAVAAVQYPPRGKRGVGLARAQGYGASFNNYCDWLSQDSVVIVQIEHIKAVENVEKILSVPGIDGYILGPYDLSASMGVPGQFENPEFIAAMEVVRNTGKRLNKAGGIHIVEPNTALLKHNIEQGFQFIAYSVDIRMIDSVCRTALLAIEQKGE